MYMIPISVCIITKNEATNLERCLSALCAYPFEIIVTDTGSTDNSKEIASGYTSRVYDFPWIQDFSAARNFCISKATNDWVLSLDTDEFIQKIDLDTLYALMQSNEGGLGSILLYSPDSSGQTTVERVSRLFQRQYYHYERPIHEQLVPSKKATVLSSSPIVFAAPIEAEHNGYSSQVVPLAEKAQRDLDILLTHTDTLFDAYSCFQIGQCYYLMQRYEDAVLYFEKAFSFPLDTQADYFSYLITGYGYSLYHLGKTKLAIANLTPLEGYFSQQADINFLFGFLYMELGNYLQAGLHYIKATNCPQYKVLGTNSFLSFYNLGILYEMMGDKDLAIAFHKRAGDYEKSKQRLAELM